MSKFVHGLAVALTIRVVAAIVAPVLIAVAAVATVYPSVQASRLFPIEAIRHE